MRLISSKIETQTSSNHASGGKGDGFPKQGRRLDAADGPNLGVVQQIPDGKSPDNAGTRKIDAANLLDAASLSAGDLGVADITARSARSRSRFKGLNLVPRYINIIGTRSRQCVPANTGQAIGRTLITIVVPSGSQAIRATRRRRDIE